MGEFGRWLAGDVRNGQQMVLSDLLGPVGGAEEKVSEQSERDRYLVGLLARRRQKLSPEEFDELPQGGSRSGEDGTAETTSLAVNCAVADGRLPFLSSANLTEYAFSINMELGVLVTGGVHPVSVERQFQELTDAGASWR